MKIENRIVFYFQNSFDYFQNTILPNTAFDTINHDLLIRKLISLELPSFVVRWVANFLTGRTQAVSSDGKLSSWLPITQSMV